MEEKMEIVILREVSPKPRCADLVTSLCLAAATNDIKTLV